MAKRKSNILGKLLIVVSERWRWIQMVLMRSFPWDIDQGSRESWDQEYREGKWDRLSDPLENGHYEVIAALCDFYEKPKILDVGCGSGILLKKLTPDRRGSYTGVDISDTAIRQAEAARIADARFQVGDLTTYEPQSDTYDIIIFNEVIQYFENPQLIIKRYQKWLKPKAMMIISLSAEGFKARLHMVGLWNNISQAGAYKERLAVEADEIRWEIRALAPSI